MARYSSKMNELRDIDSIGCRARNINIKKWENQSPHVYHKFWLKQYHKKLTNASQQAALVSDVLSSKYLDVVLKESII